MGRRGLLGFFLYFLAAVVQLWIVFRVIETIRLDEKTAPGTDVVAILGCGLLVHLDLPERNSPPVDCDAIVRVHRPDGSTFDTVVRAVEAGGPNVGLFFQDVEKHEIPLGSEIELIGCK